MADFQWITGICPPTICYCLFLPSYSCVGRITNMADFHWTTERCPPTICFCLFLQSYSCVGRITSIAGFHWTTERSVTATTHNLYLSFSSFYNFLLVLLLTKAEMGTFYFVFFPALKPSISKSWIIYIFVRKVLGEMHI